MKLNNGRLTSSVFGFKFWALLLCFTTVSLPSFAEDKFNAVGPLEVPDNSGKIMSVLGLIEPDAIGPTLMHEHIFIDFSLPLDAPDRWPLAWRQIPQTEDEIAVWQEKLTVENRSLMLRHVFMNRDSLILEDHGQALAEVSLYKQEGGGTIVELTPIGLGREPVKLKRLAEESGVNIIMGTGFYRRAWHPEDMDSRTVEDLTELMVRELALGVGDTGIRAGIIGEIPAEDLRLEPEESAEVRVLRAAGRASRITGASVSLHSDVMNIYTNWHRSLDILEEEGADLSRVVVGHAQQALGLPDVGMSDLELYQSILKRGAYIQFDTLGSPVYTHIPILDSRPSIEMIIQLIDLGYAEQILVSHDVCSKYQQTAFGGHGYTYITATLVPYLRYRGVEDKHIERLIHGNPKNILTLAPPQRLTTSTTR